MSVSSFPHSIINTFGRILLAITGIYYSGELSGPVTSAIVFNTDGSIDHNDNGSLSQKGQWWSEEPDTGIGDNYEVRALSAGASGSWTSAAAADDTWVALTSFRSWSVTRAGTGSTAVSRTWEVRRIGTSAPVESASKTVTAEVII